MLPRRVAPPRPGASRPDALRVGALCLVALLAAACTRGGGSPDPTPTPRTSGYVALGDSASAGPGLKGEKNAKDCLKSPGSYPHLLAKALDVKLVDVSCSGATSEDLVQGRGVKGKPALAPQTDALGPDTELVTLTLGGNDGAFMTQLAGYCLQQDDGKGCARWVDEDLPTAAEYVEYVVGLALQEITRIAPNAEVVLVGYLRYFPDSGTCAALGDVPASVVREARAAEVRLAQAQQRAAVEAGVRYVPMSDLAAGHDVCSDDPWMNGLEAGANDDGMELHPTQAGMEAVAAELAKVVG